MFSLTRSLITCLGVVVALLASPAVPQTAEALDTGVKTCGLHAHFEPLLLGKEASPREGGSRPLQPSGQVHVWAEQWYRIYLIELEAGRWRSAGTFENPSYEQCVRYGRGWKEGKPGYRDYLGPVGFLR